MMMTRKGLVQQVCERDKCIVVLYFYVLPLYSVLTSQLDSV